MIDVTVSALPPEPRSWPWAGVKQASVPKTSDRKTKGSHDGRTDDRRGAGRGPFGLARRHGGGVQGLRGGHRGGLRGRGAPDRAGAARAAPCPPARGRVFLRPGGDDRRQGRRPRGRRGAGQLPDQAPRADAHVLERRPRPGPAPGGDCPGGFRGVLRRARRSRRPGPTPGVGDEVRRDLLRGLGRRADLPVSPEVTRALTDEGGTGTMTPRILAFAGSLRGESFNKKLVPIAAKAVRDAGAEVTLIDLKDFPLPLFDQDLEAGQGMPENGTKLKKLFIEQDGLLIASPEHNSSFPTVLKNAIDWVSR